MPNPTASILILDDDADFAHAAADLVSLRGMNPVIAQSIAESTRIAEEQEIRVLNLHGWLAGRGGTTEGLAFARDASASASAEASGQRVERRISPAAAGA